LAQQGFSSASVADIDSALRIAQLSGRIKNELLVRESIATIYEKAGRYREALAAERRCRALHDSLSSADVKRQLTELNARFQVGQQQARITTLTQQQRIANLNTERAQSRARLWSAAAIGLAGLLMLGGWLLRQVRRSRAQLALSEADLRAANTTKDQLLRIIGHDLRAPLATFQQIAPTFERLATEPNPPAQIALARDLAEYAQNVHALVDNLLDWSRAQAGQVVAHPQPCQLVTEATSLRRVFAPAAQAKGIRLVVNVADDFPASYPTDPHLLMTILRNLLGNALKFTPNGGTVTLGLARTEAAVAISVADSGVGMTAEKLTAALVGDAVGSTTGTSNEAGTGLGLAVCRHFASLLGATWTGESTVGQGTRWELILPQM
jgi:signal transduction histidine kinase